MGLIRAAMGAAGGVMADQWKEYFYCEAMPADLLATRGWKRQSGRSANTKGSDNIITNGSIVAVADGQCAMIVEQGKVVDICAEPGEYTYDTGSAPTLFSGDLSDSIGAVFQNIGKRFTFGGEAPMDQRIYYFNTKEILNNKFGTANPIMFEVVNKRIGMSRTVQVRCNGVYTYVISDPLDFYSRLCGNVATEFTRDEIDAQLKVEFVDALQPALGALAEQELRPAQIPAKANELKAAMNDALKQEWIENRGISVAKIALNPITLTDAAGIWKPCANAKVHLGIEGPAALQALGSAATQTEETYLGSSHTTWLGRALAVIRAGTEPGKVRVTVTAEGYEPQYVDLTVK